MEFIDLKAQQARIRDKIEQRIKKVLDHGQYILGPEVAELEEKLAHYVGVKHCIGVSSGTDGLLIAMMALGIGRDDEVITTPFTFIATAEMICLLGAKPVFVDIDPRTYNIDPGKIEAAISPRTRAIMPVSLYGQCADFDAINAIADRHGLPVIEDAAQSFGATYKNRRSCSLSTIGVTSFFPSKPLGCYGDAGACFTDDEALAKRMRQIRMHGQVQRYQHAHIGLNGRMDTIQAAILLEKLTIYPDEIERRQSNGNQYTRLFDEYRRSTYQDCKIYEKLIVPPYISKDNTSVYAQYTLATEHREHVQGELKKSGIPTAVHYPMPLHWQQALNNIGYRTESFQNAITASNKVLSLPMHPYLTEYELARIVEKVDQVIQMELHNE